MDNPNHTLWPGTYVDVVFQVPTDPTVLTMPEAALIFRADGAQVAIVDAQNHVHLRNVTLGQNLGQTVQVTSGLSPGDKLVNNPPAGLLEGQSVQPVTPVTGYAMATQKTKATRHETTCHSADRSLGVGLLSGCDLAPVYEPPHFILPASYQGSGPVHGGPSGRGALTPRGLVDAVRGRAVESARRSTRASNPTLQAAADAYAPGTRPGRRGAVGTVPAGECERRHVVK